MTATLHKPLVEFLMDEYQVAMEAQNANAAPDQPKFDIDVMTAQLSSFKAFAHDYLAQYPITQYHTNMSGTYGIELTNRRQCLVGLPLDELKGTMQPSEHQAVTGQATASDMQQADAIPMTGQSNLIPPDAVDFSAPGTPQNMSHQQPQVRYDQQHPAVRTG